MTEALAKLGGMLCDMGANTFYGFYTLTLFLYGAAVGLALIYLMKNDRKRRCSAAWCIPEAWR